MISDFSRHMELFDPYKFDTPVTVIGAGATASWLVLMLARLGIKNITVFDFDVVEEHNVPNQAFGLQDIGKKKVEALQEMVHVQTGVDIVVHDKRFIKQRLNGIVFCMIDTMEGRKQIWEDAVKMKTRIDHYIEPRMGLDMARIYNVNPMDLNHIKQYETTFYGDEDAEVSACGTSLTVVTSAVATASWCARQLINFVNGEELDNEILVDYKYNNIIATNWEGLK